MTDEVKVRVRLDTTQAQAELDRLNRAGGDAGERIGREVRGALKKGLNAVGVGAAFGAGFAAIKGATQSGVGDVFGETFGAISSGLNDFFLGTVDDESRAASRAREETSQAFALVAGVRGEIPPQARAFFETVKTVRLQEEKGRSLFAMDDAFRGPGLMSIIDRIGDKFAEIMADAVSALGDMLIPSWMK